MPNPSSDNQNVLRALTSLGLHVFPIPRMKRVPVQKAFYDIATSDPDFSLDLNNAGVATGDGIVVLDIDVKGGRDGRPALEALGPLPLTLTVRTPSGGQHLYFALPPGVTVSNSVNRLGLGIDVRGHHGYVLAPGSATPVGVYAIERTVPSLPLLPDHILRRARAPRERDDTTPAVDLDTPEAIAAAAEWLTGTAPPAIEGAGGNDMTYRTAARVKDFGVSAAMCVELLADYWNERNAPPWDREDLERIAGNAYDYGSSAPGAKAPSAEFSEALTPAQLAAVEATRLAHMKPAHEHQPDTTPLTSLKRHLAPTEPFDPTRDLAPRRFVLGHMLARGVVATIVSPPGIGKTTLVAEFCAAVASARPFLGPRFAPVGGPAHALLWCQEDDLNELHLRLAAIMQHFGLTWADFHDPLSGTSRLHILSGVERPLQIAVSAADNRTLTASQDAVDVLAYIQAHGIALAAFDPLTELHPGDENDNGQMGKVARTFRTIAARGDCNCLLVHHTKKHDMASSDDFAGDMWSGRGAGAVAGVARYVATMYTVGEKCAKQYGIGAEERHRFVRFDDAKNNLGPLAGAPAFFERVSVVLDGLGSVGVLVPVERQIRAREVSDVGASAFAADVRFVVDRIMEKGVRAVTWGQAVDALRADRYGEGESEPGRYALTGEDALRKRVRRLFDDATGTPVADEMDGLILRRKGAAAYISLSEFE